MKDDHTHPLKIGTYIKIAVELADGWDWNTYSHILTISRNATRDALAAQLRRQCRKIDKWVDVQILQLKDEAAPDYRNYDEAMHDIKAIVDSKVLKDEAAPDYRNYDEAMHDIKAIVDSNFDKNIDPSRNKQ